MPKIPTNSNVDNKKMVKQVTWADQVDNTNTPFLRYGSAATLSKKSLDLKVSKLMAKYGYTEEQACAIVGKPITPSGKLLLLEPSFYDSREKIDKQKEHDRLNAPSKQSVKVGHEISKYASSFFTTKNIGLATTAIAAVSLFLFAFKK